MQTFLKSEADRTASANANATQMLLALELANLKRAIDRGEAYAEELAAAKKVGGVTLNFAPLERYMQEGAPAPPELAKSFRKVANAMLDAEAEPPDATLVDRLLSGARSIVRVRKAGHAADDTSLEAADRAHGDRAEGGPARRRAGQRQEAAAQGGAGGRGLGQEGRGAPGRRSGHGRGRGRAQGVARRPQVGCARTASDDPSRRLSRSSSSPSPPACTGSPTGRARSSSNGRTTSPRPACSAPSSSWCWRLALVMVVWSALRALWSSPAAVGRLLNRRRQKRGLDALSSGIIAIGAGDGSLAIRYAGQARKALPNEPLTHLLRAQTAQLTGDRATSRRIFEAMLASPDTEQLGLRGLFLEAQREGEREAARQFAERALKLNPKLGWPVEALFDLQCRAEDWQGALDTLADRAAQQPDRQDGGQPPPRRAADRPGAGGGGYGRRQGARAGAARRIGWRPTWCPPRPSPAACWPRRATRRAPRACCSRPGGSSPHPELAAAYAYARPGDSPRDRLNRVRHLGRLTPHDTEGPIALAITAIEAREWDEARERAGAAARGPPDAARRHADGAHRGRAARPHRPRARVAGAGRQRAARSRLDGRRHGLGPLGAGLAGDGRARCLPLARAGGGDRRDRRARCWRPRSRRWWAWAPAREPALAHAAMPSRRRRSRRRRRQSPSIGRPQRRSMRRGSSRCPPRRQP